MSRLSQSPTKNDASSPGLEDLTRTSKNENITKDIIPSLKKLNLWQNFKIRAFGSIFINNVQLEEWKDLLPFYAFRCHKHGTQIGYPSGWRNTLSCPLCYKENTIQNNHTTL